MKIEHIVIIILAIIAGYFLLGQKSPSLGGIETNTLTEFTQTTSTVGNYPAVKTTLLAANSARSYLVIKNQETSVDLYLHFGDATATLATSYRLKPGEQWTGDYTNLYRGVITAFASSATATAVSIIQAY